MPLTHDEARAVLDKALAFTQADEAEAELSSRAHGHLRFARNTPTTAGQTDDTHLSLTCVFGRKVGQVSTTDLSENGLQDAARRAEDAARLAPESLEYLPRLGPQSYLDVPGCDLPTAQVSGPERMGLAADALREAQARSVTTAGFLEDSHTLSARANTHGLWAAHEMTHAEYSLTMRTPGGGSGWAGNASFRYADLAAEGRQMTQRALDKALRSENPVTLEPGAYPTVLEPSTVADQVGLLLWSMDRRAADEGRSYFADKDAGTKLGQTLFADSVTITSDPTNSVLPSRPWGEDGLPLAPTVWVQNGRLENLSVSRYWAKEKNIAPMPRPSNVLMAGGEQTLDDLIAATEYGLLVTSFWYIRSVDPKTLLNTGLTRDGLFLIENGQVTRPVVNFRWNESPAVVLAGVESMSRPERTLGRETGTNALVPALKLREFHFASVSPSS
jgi:predicted Zn-dependent protease